MAQFAKILEISQELTVKNEWEHIYSDKGMLWQLRINRQLSSLEDIDWNYIKQHPVQKRELFEEFLLMVEEAQKMQIFPAHQQSLSLLSIQNFKSEYGGNLDRLVDDMCRCFELERQLIQRVINKTQTPPDQSVDDNQISDDHLKDAEAMMHRLHGLMTTLKSKTDNKAVLRIPEGVDHGREIFQNTIIDNARVHNQAQIQDTGIFTDVASRWENLLRPVQDIWSRLILACDACNEELTSWKSLQKQHYISPGAEDPQRILNSTCISDRCAKAGLLLWQFLRMNQDILAFVTQKLFSDSIAAIVQEVLRYFRSLLQSSFVLTVQSDPFTLTSKKREFSLRILAAESLRLGPLKATAELVPETALSRMKQSQSQRQIKTLVTMEADICGLSPLKEAKKFLMEMKRETTKGPNKVWEDMHRIRFWAEFRLLESIPISLEMFSLPFAIVSAANQIVDGHGAVFWRLCAQSDIETSFDMPDTMPWSVISTALSDKFLHQTGRGLEEHQLQHLASRLNLLPEQTDTDGNIIEERRVTRDNFYKKFLEDTEFTFWKWYYAACNLLVTAQPLLEPWREKLIYGFLGKIASEQLLEDQPNGTFLMRFADSMVSDPKSNHITGFLSTSSIQDRTDSEHTSKFCHCEPYPVDVLAKKSIGQLLIETDFCRQNVPKPFRFLYPEGKNCEEAFSKYIKATPDILKKLTYIPFKTKETLDTALSRLEIDSDNVKGHRITQAKELLYPGVQGQCNRDLFTNDEHKPIKRKRTAETPDRISIKSNFAKGVVKDLEFNAKESVVKIVNKSSKNHPAQSSRVFKKANCGCLMTNNEDLSSSKRVNEPILLLMDALNSSNDNSNIPVNDSTGPTIMESDMSTLFYTDEVMFGTDPMLPNVEALGSGQNVPNLMPDKSFNSDFIDILSSVDGTDV